MSNTNDYAIGWICALSTEYVAAQEFLDEEHEAPDFVSPNDTNDYTLGRLGKHNVVIAVLADGEYGTASAATVATNMLNSFPNVRIGLMVGIGGGAPSDKHNIRLGDIVVSTPRNGEGGVFQYDFGKTIQGQAFQNTRFLNQPPATLRAASTGIQALYKRKGHQLEEAINCILKKNPRLQQEYERPQPGTDRLFKSDIIHGDSRDCAEFCAKNPSNLAMRRERTSNEDNPTVHYGLIASANQLMKDASIRDKLAAEKDVLCFEMEAAGLMNHFPCLVIRGICDYSDSHKNKEWQGYAAMAAAAYAKDLLCRILPNKIEAEKRITDIVSGLQDGVDELLRTEHGREHDTILNWLTPIDYARQQNYFIDKRQNETGQWLLDSNKFRDWLSQGHQTLFCPGIPGAGKTIITSIVVQYLHTAFRTDHTTGIAYVYCDSRRQFEQKPIDLLLSLLKQLIQELPSTPETVKDLYHHHKDKRTRPSFSEISEALQSVIASYSRAFIIVDALDECRVFDGECRKFLSEILNLQAETTGMSFFATSRFILDITKEFKRSLTIEICASDDDLEKYLSGKLLQFRPFVLENFALQKEIKDEVIKAADGMFLLAQLHMDSLASKITPKAVRIVLKSFRRELGASTGDEKRSKALEQAYARTMERIEGQEEDFRNLAKKVLSWIICTRRPLTTSEFQHALAVEIDQSELDKENIPEIEDMVFVCAGLVTVDRKGNIIRLLHYTAQEYFERFCYSWLLNVEKDIARTCITYLSFHTFDAGFCGTDWEFETRLRENPLYNYAALNWGFHARASSTEVEEMTLDFLRSESTLCASIQALMVALLWANNLQDGNYSQRPPRQMNGLHLAAYFGLKESILALLDDQNIDVEDTYGQTPLSWAIENGHEAVVELLFEKGAKMDHKYTPYKRTFSFLWPLTDALRKFWWNMLLRTPLSRAVEIGSETMVKLLIDKGIELESKDHLFYGKSLLRAAENGHEALVKVLLERGVDPNTRDDDRQTPLLMAAPNGHRVVVKMLLEKGADPESKGNDGWTALSLAAGYGHETLVKLLLEKGAEVQSKGTDGRTPLSLAAEYGHEAVVKLLLEKGAE